MINMLKSLFDNIDNIYEQIDNVKREMEIL